MKSIKLAFVFLATGIILVTAGCKKDRPVLDPPGSKLDGINATWIMVEVNQTDVASIQQKSLNVSTAFIGSKALEMTFNSGDMTYSVEKGSGPNYFGEGGTWEFDDNEYPTQITLNPSAGNPIVLPLVRTIRPVDTYLNFSMTRTCANEEDPYIGYEFKFIRTN